MEGYVFGTCGVDGGIFDGLVDRRPFLILRKLFLCKLPTLVREKAKIIFEVLKTSRMR